MAQTKVFKGTARSITSVIGGGTAYSYHGTAVVTLYPDRVVFDSGGWQTATTSRAIQQALSENGISGISVFQRKGKWYVDHFGTLHNFFDGITLSRIDNG